MHIGQRRLSPAVGFLRFHFQKTCYNTVGQETYKEDRQQQEALNTVYYAEVACLLTSYSFYRFRIFFAPLISECYYENLLFYALSECLPKFYL